MDAADVWDVVHRYATKRLADQQPIYTTDKKVRNFIADVKPSSIGRRSDEGTTNASRVTRGEVERLWDELHGGPAVKMLFFTRALVAEALGDFVRSQQLDVAVDVLRNALIGASGPEVSARVAALLDQLDYLPRVIATAGTARRFGHPVDAEGIAITVGTAYRDRVELAAAGVHKPLQAGISGSVTKGADSIVLSGGYEDDQDLGDEIVYTGQGGQDERTKRQVRDQAFTRGNRALVVSCLEGRPVRVVRGAELDSKFAPASGYRYDGLFRVDEYWQERGRAGFLMCRFRLVRAPEDLAPRPGADPSLGAAGNMSPPRRGSTVQRVVRSTAVALEIKKLYDHCCQICGTRLESAAGPYAEAAHIRGLGRPHNGPDVSANVICLCPNHHVLFDLGAFHINDDLTLGGGVCGKITMHPKHRIDLAHVAYHRERHAGVLSGAGDEGETT